MGSDAKMKVRSKLFVPACRPELFDKALASDADALSIDLEDAVQHADKDRARRAAHDLLTHLATDPVYGRVGDAREAGKKWMIVRVNGLSTIHFENDLAAVITASLDVVNIPKVESADDVLFVEKRLEEMERRAGLSHRIGILANIESPKGLRYAHQIATASSRLVGLQLGYGDLFEPIGIARHHRGALEHAMLAARLAAAEGGVEAYDGAYGRIADMTGFTDEALRARELGFAGKTCVHPVQIAAANRVFSPTPAEVAFARRVVDAWAAAKAAGRGAVVVDGLMIDEPYAVKAAQLCAQPAG